MWVMAHSGEIDDHMSKIRTHLEKAPLVRTELNLLWGDGENRVLVQPSELRGLPAAGESGAAYEWLIPRDFLDIEW